MTRIVHHKKEPYDVYIGRPSKWGNPFIVGVDGNRKEVLELYETYIMESDLLNDLHELKDKVLGCWCKPKSCHGDILVFLCDNKRIL